MATNPQTTLPPCPRDTFIDVRTGKLSQSWFFWITQIQRVLSMAGGIAWNLVHKGGSNLTDIETRNHNDLQSRSTAAAHPATAIVNTPANGILADDVQEAINELQTHIEELQVVSIMRGF